MTDINIAEYIPTIKNILENSVHSEITARDVRLKLEQKFKVDLTSRKHEVQRLVEQCFDALDIKTEGSEEELNIKTEGSEEELNIKTEGSEEEQVVKKESKSNVEKRRTKSTGSHERKIKKSQKSQKSRVKSNVSDYSSLEDEKQKKKRGRKRKNSPVDDSDAEYERRFEEELKKTKSKSNGISKKKSSSHKRKRKDDDEGNEEKKKRKGITGIHKPLVLSPVLSKFLNAEELSRLEVVKRLWAYIKENHLQDPNDKRYIVCDEKLTSIFKHERIHSFTMNKYLTDHLKKKEDLVVKVERGNSSSVNEDDHDYSINNDHNEKVKIKTEEVKIKTEDLGEAQYKFEEVKIKSEDLDEAQYKFEDDRSEIGDDDGDDDGFNDVEWA